MKQDRPPLRIAAAALEEIHTELGRRPAELGGVLGGSYEDGTIRHFYFDTSARRTGATYSPDHVTVNRLLKEDWNPRGIRLLGFGHSHPPGFRRPSGGDLVYARNILKAIPDLDRLLLPIIMTEPDTGRFEFLPFSVVRDGDDVRVEEMKLRVVVSGTAPSPAWPQVTAPAALPPAQATPRHWSNDLETLVFLLALTAGGAVAYIWLKWLERRTEL